MISLVSREQVLNSARSTFALGDAAQHAQLLDSTLVCAIVRRVAGLYCPCSPSTLSTITAGALQGLAERELVDLVVDQSIEDLVAWGDLLELTDVTSVEESLPKTSLFAAPPTFVALDDGNVAIAGIAEESELPLPEAFGRRLERRGFRRFLRGHPHEELGRVLLAYGYREMAIEGWLRQPDAILATQFVERHDFNLGCSALGPAVDGLVVYDRGASKHSYKSRWVEPGTRVGRYVGRRPQAYGQPLWCYVEIAPGGTVRLLDLPLKGGLFRGCDAAWRLQHAMDAAQGVPQSFLVRRAGEHAHLLFQFPIPLWAQRRLCLLGDRIESGNCLFAFAIPVENLETEASNLASRLWLTRVDN